MELSELRRWHWIVIGALLGLVIGYSINAIGLDGIVTGGAAARTAQMTFESELTRDPMVIDGVSHAWIKDVVVYPDGPIYLIKMTQFVNKDPDKSEWESKKWAHETTFYEAPRPYSPLIGAPHTEVWVKPDFHTDGYQGDNNWRNADGQGSKYRDPGADGSRLYLDIGKGDYTFAITVDSAKEAADLTAKFNDHPLAPFTVDPSNPRIATTTIPLADFGTDNARTLWLSRKDSPVHIRQIHIFNPTYTVRDYLDAIQAAHPGVKLYKYAWWTEPRAVLWLSVGICVFVIGIIWPTVIGVLVGAGLGPPPREKGIDLRKLKATPVPVPLAKGPTDEDLASLEALEAKLLKSLESDSDEEEVGATTATAAGPAPVRVLNAKPVEAPAPPPKKEEGPKTFKGEFYPVARKAGDPAPKKPE